MKIELHIDDEVWIYKHESGKLPKYFFVLQRVFEIKHGTNPVQYHAVGVGQSLDGLTLEKAE